jgi:hypothetical protein
MKTKNWRNFNRYSIVFEADSFKIVKFSYVRKFKSTSFSILTTCCRNLFLICAPKCILSFGERSVRCKRNAKETNFRVLPCCRCMFVQLKTLFFSSRMWDKIRDFRVSETSIASQRRKNKRWCMSRVIENRSLSKTLSSQAIIFHSYESIQRLTAQIAF